MLVAFIVVAVVVLFVIGVFAGRSRSSRRRAPAWSSASGGTTRR